MMADVFVGTEGLQLDAMKDAEPVKHAYLLLGSSTKELFHDLINYSYSLHVVCLDEDLKMQLQAEGELQKCFVHSPSTRLSPQRHLLP